MQVNTAMIESGYQMSQRRLTEMKQERQSWEDHWKELTELFCTRRGRWITDSKTQRGNKRNQKLIDPTPRFAARTLGAGMHAGSTNPASPWFRLVTPDPEMMEFPSVSLWLYMVENSMRDVFGRTNLYSVLPTTYTEAGVYGTSPILMVEHPAKVIHFLPKTIGSYYLAKNTDGVVDTMYCEYTMTTRQLVEDFGIESVSQVVKTDFERGGRNKYWNVLHVVEPRESRDGSYNAKNMPWKSCYYELDGTNKEKHALRESGFEDNPIAAFLWETTELTDPYGSSCGMDALGCAKAIQVQTKQKAKVVDKHVDPPMVADPALRNQPSTLLPGDVTYAGFTPTGSAPKFQPAIQTDPRGLTAVIEDIADTRELVREAMYTNLFLAITMADPRNATVPEIIARKEEQILALGPVLQNHEDGLIKPIIDRTFNAMMRQGRIPPPPPELEGVNLKVELMGALAQAFRAIAGGKLERFVSYVGSVAEAQAKAGQTITVFDKFDADQSVDEYAQAIGIPPTVVRSDEAVAMMRDERARQAQAAQAAQMAPALKDVTGAAKNLSETQVGGRSALDALVEAA